MSNKEKDDFIFKLQELCSKIEYLIAFKSDENDNVKGFIIGNTEFLKDIIADLPDAEDYEIYQLDPKTDTELH